MALPEYPMMSIEDYLLLDNNSRDARYEYLEGQLRMLAGGSTYHAAIIARLTSLLDQALDKSPCWVYNSDVRLQLSEARYVHPDISVSCDQDDQELNDTIRNPRLVVEVLSPSTEAIDRGKKAIYYQECFSIQEYVIVDSLSIRVEVYHRKDSKWEFSTYGPGSSVEIESLGIQIPLDAIYKRMKMDKLRIKKR